MKASETKLQNIIEGTKQFIVPLFQRSYSWTSKEWEILWKDIVELCEMENPRTHFIGSIVSLPMVSVPEGVAKYLLIDGQQRLTTIFILLILLRNKSKEKNNLRFASEINNTLLVNEYKDDLDYYKLLPTQSDRKVYQDIIKGDQTDNSSLIFQAYKYFDNKIKQKEKLIEYSTLKTILTNYLSTVSIVLEADDNPYLVFESLNAKGKPLTQADLIRNYFFMRIHTKDQDEVYKSYWEPMQLALKDNLTEYIRHYLMKDGKIVNQNDVYFSLKEIVSNNNNVIEYIQNLQHYSNYYYKLIQPEQEPDIDIRKYLVRLNRIEVTTAYPLLLNFYHLYDQNEINKDQFISILMTLENFLTRRFVCSIPTNQLNKIFPGLFGQIQQKYPIDYAIGFKEILFSKGYPKDIEFYTRFKEAKFYGAGDRREKTKLILETIEENFEHKERISFENLTIEHIMPQTITDEWKLGLGENWEETYELYLHTIGNLTLTGYNPELSRKIFEEKKKLLLDSHLELNKYFLDTEKWNREDIEKRSEKLAHIALEIWANFGHEKSADIKQLEDVTGKVPVRLKVLGQNIIVNSWRDVMENTFNIVSDLEPDKFSIIVETYTKYININNDGFRSSRKLNNGYFINVDLSAEQIRKICHQITDTIELSSEDWCVEVKI